MTSPSPAGMPFENVFIGLGSNLGGREHHLRLAREKLRSHPEIELRQQSSLYRTAPVGVLDQPEFLNQVIEIATRLTPQALLHTLLQIERELGRVRDKKWGPRTIDLDILAFDQRRINTTELVVPHPEIRHRRFVLAPWAEIAPDFRPPESGQTVAELFASCNDKSAVQV